MEIRNLKMARFNTTLMGVLRGMADFYGIRLSDPMLYGGSGHAFLMNIHPELCPSGPYCWKLDRSLPLLRNLGIQMHAEGFFGAESTKAERAAIEALLKSRLDAGAPCSLLNLEHQLITGYDSGGLITAQPWAPHLDFPPGHLTFGTWEELGNEIHISFYTFQKTALAERNQTISDGLGYALELYEHPERHTDPPYAVGVSAWDNWIDAVRHEYGASHGNWWNALVWSECREGASKFFQEISRTYPRLATQACELAAGFAAISEALMKASDKRMEPGQKIELLQEAREREATCMRGIRRLAPSFV